MNPSFASVAPEHRHILAAHLIPIVRRHLRDDLRRGRPDWAEAMARELDNLELAAARGMRVERSAS